MLGPDTIRLISDVAAYRAAEEEREPLIVWRDEDVRHMPFLGDYVPAGWREALWSDMHTTPRVGWPWDETRPASVMVDSSGFGATDEPALTLAEFAAFVRDSQRPQHTTGWAIVEAGEYQIVAQAFIEDATATGSGTPDRASVECEDCHEVHGPFDECEGDRCPDCERDMTAGELHTLDCPLAIAQDHADGDHSGCDHE